MVLFKKRKGESVLRVKLDLILYIMHNINHQSLKNIHRNIYVDTKGQTGCEHKTSEIWCYLLMNNEFRLCKYKTSYQIITIWFFSPSFIRLNEKQFLKKMIEPFQLDFIHSIDKLLNSKYESIS